MNPTQMVEARRKAEKAVEGMPDGPMKIKAFEIFLNQLLLPSPTQGERNSSESMRKHRSQGTPRTAPARVVFLRDDGFFSSPRTLGEIRTELQTHGWVYPLTSLSGTVQSLVQRRELRRTLVSEGKKKAFRYVNP